MFIWTLLEAKSAARPNCGLMTAGLSDSAVSGPAAALLLARGICRALDQLGYASPAAASKINALWGGYLFHIPPDIPPAQPPISGGNVTKLRDEGHA